MQQLTCQPLQYVLPCVIMPLMRHEAGSKLSTIFVSSKTTVSWWVGPLRIVHIIPARASGCEYTRALWKIKDNNSQWTTNLNHFWTFIPIRGPLQIHLDFETSLDRIFNSIPIISQFKNKQNKITNAEMQGNFFFESNFETNNGFHRSLMTNTLLVIVFLLCCLSCGTATEVRNQQH